MSRPFVGNGKAPATSACRCSTRVAAIGNGACAGNHNDPWSSAEGRLESDGAVAHDIDFSLKNLRQDVVHHARGLGASGTGGTHTNAPYLLRGDSGSSAGLTHRLMVRLPSSGLSHANDVAWTCAYRGDQMAFCAQHASCL